MLRFWGRGRGGWLALKSFLGAVSCLTIKCASCGQRFRVQGQETKRLHHHVDAWVQGSRLRVQGLVFRV